VQILGKCPLFHGNTNEEVLKEMEVWNQNTCNLKAEILKQHADCGEALWELLSNLLDIDPTKRMSTKEAKRFFEAHFPEITAIRKVKVIQDSCPK
jgi:hypothetical protein